MANGYSVRRARNYTRKEDLTMVESKTLVMKMEEAQMVSLQTGEKVRVMTKPRKKPVVCCSEFVYRERVLNGWSTYCWFTAGKING